VITYVDTSVVLKLLIDDEVGGDAAERLWVSSDYLVCAEIGYVEARAALAAAHRNSRLTARALRTAKEELEGLWAQLDVVAIGTGLIRAAGELAEGERLRGYDAIHLASAVAAHATVLASADDRLIAAARHCGLGTSNPLQPPT
jgi:predicted nucleic acid-binding protein